MIKRGNFDFKKFKLKVIEVGWMGRGCRGVGGIKDIISI